MKKINYFLRNHFRTVAALLLLAAMTAGTSLRAEAARLPYTPYCSCICENCVGCENCVHCQGKTQAGAAAPAQTQQPAQTQTQQPAQTQQPTQTQTPQPAQTPAPPLDERGLTPDDLYYLRQTSDPFLFVPNMGQKGTFHGLAGGEDKATVEKKFGTDFLPVFQDPNPGGISIYSDPAAPDYILWIQYDAQDRVSYIVYQKNPALTAQ